jgi:Flavin reductase like domain
MLDGSLGALSCKLVLSPIPLHDLGLLGNGDLKGGVPLSKEGVASELFIARVMRVESMSERTLPLVYYRRYYTTLAEMSHSRDCTTT